MNSEQIKNRDHRASDPEEPRLKYTKLGSDVNHILKPRIATCLGVSDKYLALGTSQGTVHVLDFDGNEVKRLREHTSAITDLSFSSYSDTLASSSADGSIAVIGLTSEESWKFKAKYPVTCIALDPRYSSRKTKELVYGTSQGTLTLTSKGWLGNAETLLFQGKGPVYTCRMSGTLLAWVTDTGLRVYDTSNHTRIGKISPPSSVLSGTPPAAAAVAASGGNMTCSVMWRGQRQLYVGWGRHVSVVDVLPMKASGSLQPVGIEASGSLSHPANTTTTTTSEASIESKNKEVGSSSNNNDDNNAVASEDINEGQLNAQQSNDKASDVSQQDQERPASASTTTSSSLAGWAYSSLSSTVASVTGTGGGSITPNTIAATSTATGAVRSSPYSLHKYYLQVLLEVDVQGQVLGAAPFGSSELAVLTWLENAPTSLASSRISTNDNNKSNLSTDMNVNKTLSIPLEAAEAEAKSDGDIGKPTVAVQIVNAAGQILFRDPLAVTTELEPGKLLSFRHFQLLCSYPESAPYFSTRPPPQNQVKISPLAPPPPSAANDSLNSELTTTPRGTSTTVIAAAVCPYSPPTPVEKAAAQAVSVSLLLDTFAGADTSDAAAGNKSIDKQGTSVNASGSCSAEAVAEDGTLLSTPRKEVSSSKTCEGAAPTRKGEREFLSATVNANRSQEVNHNQQQQQQQDNSSQNASFKWWKTGAEPLYFISTPKDVLIGRPREGDDRIMWLVERKSRACFDLAMHVASTDPSVSAGVVADLGEQYLQFLIDGEEFEAAASLAPKALATDADGSAWERWVYTFSQHKKLHLLGDVLPIHRPVLPSTTYDMVLASFLLVPESSLQLLQLLKQWPVGIYDANKLLTAITSRIKTPRTLKTASTSASGSFSINMNRALQQVAALLHSQLGDHHSALSIYLDLQLPDIFYYIQQHGVLALVAHQAAALVSIDEEQGLSLFVEGHEEAPPKLVVDSFLYAIDHSSSSSSRKEGAAAEDTSVGKRRLYNYLEGIYKLDAAAASPFADLHVELCACFAPAALLNFLTTNSFYHLDKAYHICEERNLVKEMVFILGRMGSTDKALRLIVEQLQDLQQAVEFAQTQNDQDLWDLLISLALGDAALTGNLLDLAGGYVDPVRVVSRIPSGMAIQNLQARLVKIIADSRAHMTLQQGCNAVLRSDCIQLMESLYMLLRRALKELHIRHPTSEKWLMRETLTGVERVEDVVKVPGPMPDQKTRSAFSISFSSADGGAAASSTRINHQKQQTQLNPKYQSQASGLVRSSSIASSSSAAASQSRPGSALSGGAGGGGLIPDESLPAWAAAAVHRHTGSSDSDAWEDVPGTIAVVCTGDIRTSRTGFNTGGVTRGDTRGKGSHHQQTTAGSGSGREKKVLLWVGVDSNNE